MQGPKDPPSVVKELKERKKAEIEDQRRHDYDYHKKCWKIKNNSL